MNEMRCQHVRHSLGVYVLGSIDPADRSAVDEHLSGCPDCRGELAGLAGLPALLGRVPAAEAAEIAGFDTERAGAAAHPASDTLTPLLGRVAHQRRVRAWRGLAAVAAAVLIIAVLSVSVIRAFTSGPDWEFARTAEAGRHAVFGYAWEPGGTRLEARVSGIPSGTTCEFVVIGPHGKKSYAGTWTVVPGTAGTWYQTSSSVRPSQLEGFEITWNHAVLAHVSVN